MIIISDTQARFAITIGSIALGLILVAFSYISGDKPLIKPDLRDAREYVWENKIKNEKLAGWIMRGKRDFFLAGFRNEKECILQREKTKFFSCFPKEKIDDIFWIRKQYPNLLVPMLIYGKDANESFLLATKLRYYGYNARMLEDGFDGFDRLYLAPVSLQGDEDDALKLKILRKQRLYNFFTGNKRNSSNFPVRVPVKKDPIVSDEEPEYPDEEEEGC